MIIIADSGSTKTDWRLVDPSGQQTYFESKGLNPYHLSTYELNQELSLCFENLASSENVKQIYFYGAGCADAFHCGKIEQALHNRFTEAIIEVYSDMLGAARACCGHQAGITCILGTGSNSCLYDGHQITDNVPALGYLVGDEGSGTHLGKKLLRAYFYRALPPDLEKAFDLKYPEGKQAIKTAIYSQEKPNVYLASFTTFLSEQIENPFIEQLVYESFYEFLVCHVKKYEGYTNLPIHFIGSIAYHFEAQLKKLFKHNNLQLGKIIQKPIVELVAYHKN